MSKSISNKNVSEYQLIILGIELAYKILSLEDCEDFRGTLATNPHLVKACELAKEWNEIFFQVVVNNSNCQRNG